MIPLVLDECVELSSWKSSILAQMCHSQGVY